MTLAVALGCLAATVIGVAALYWAAGRLAAASAHLTPLTTSSDELHHETRQLHAAVEGRLAR